MDLSLDPPAKIVVLGAGPIGLEAALYARYLGYDVEVFERDRVAENVRRWGHVRMFSPFSMNCSSLGLAALAAQDDNYQPPPGDDLLTGLRWAQSYVIPLSETDLLDGHIHPNSRVVSIGRQDFLKCESPGDAERGESPFRLLVRNGQGERVVLADAVIDASGVYRQPRPLGRGGIGAMGESSLASEIEYGLPDVLGKDREAYASRHTLLIGAGYSAATTAKALAELASQAAGTRVTWITRGRDASNGGPLCRIEGDRLPERDALAAQANRLATDDASPVAWRPGTHVEAISFDEHSETFEVVLSGEVEGAQTFDRVVANTGHRPDTSLWGEVQIQQCYATDGPMKLAAALLGEASADCLDQASTGPQSLLNPEPHFYILGAKSFGRGSQFLFSQGLIQIRDVFTIIGGREGLNLYATVKPPGQ